MTVWAVSLAMAFTMVEICGIFLKNLWLRKQPAALQTSLSAFQSAETDEERQRLLLQSSYITMRYSLACAMLVVLLAGALFLPVGVFSWDRATQETYLFITSLAATVWCLVRGRLMPHRKSTKVSKHSHVYSRLDRWLHWLALEPMAVRQLSFELERLFALPRQLPAKQGESKPVHGVDGAVYVCGMARSGTTMVLNILDKAPEFKSLNYRDMPFVLAPNLWRLIHSHSKRKVELTERIHGDGVMVDYDSPEAFEEVFWRTFSGVKARKDTGYGGPPPDAETLSAFADYRALITNHKTMQGSPTRTHRYLSKNNNNLLRIKPLAADSAATVLLVYRDPIDTARSSFRLHQALGVAKADKFTLTYMDWLGHHEFGVGHIPMGFALQYMNSELLPQDQNYWLDYWNAIYKHALTQLGPQVILIDYDALCQNPFAALTAINNKLGINNNVQNLVSLVRQGSKTKHASVEFDANLVNAAYATYKKLKADQYNILNTHSIYPLNKKAT